MTRRICALLLCLSLLLQGVLPLRAFEKPKKTFYETAGWLDHVSNTLRRVAERGEQGAYDLYKNPNPSPRNAYEKVNIHQANLTDLRLYQNSEPYRQAKQIRDAFTAETAASENTGGEEVSEEDLNVVRAALSELMSLYIRTGEYYPMVTQSVLETARYMLPLQKRYRLFEHQHLPVLKTLYIRILNRKAQCGQGEGYRIFCEGRADALEGMAQLAQTPQEAQLIARVLEEDVQQPYIARELSAGAAALLLLRQEALLDSVLAKAVDKEGETFWQKIDVFMTGWWINKIQFRNGRYLGNVTAMGVLPAAYGQADGNAWEELARLLYNEGHPTPASARLLARYGLGSCEAELNDWDDGKAFNVDGRPLLASVSCKTLLPFLAGALDAGARDGAGSSLQKAAQAVRLSPAAYVSRLYFENVMGDLNAETELRLDNMFYRVFAAELKEAEARRRAALEHNRQLDEKIETVRQKIHQSLLSQEYFQPEEGGILSRGWKLQGEMTLLENQKVPVPQLADTALKPYDRNSDIYKRKATGQKIYGAVREVSGAVDIGLGIYYTLALPAAAVKSVQWGLSLKRGLNAVRAGRVTADARRLAALSARLKKIRSLSVSSAARAAKNKLVQSLASLRSGTGTPAVSLPSAERAPSVVSDVRSGAVSAPRAAVSQTARRNPAEPLPVVRPVTGKAETAPSASLPSSLRSPDGSGRVSSHMLRRARLAADQSAPSASQPNLAQLRLSALSAVEEMKKLASLWKDAGIAALKQDPVRMGRAVRAVRDYVRLEKDLEFYRALPAAPALELPPAVRLTLENSLFSPARRDMLVREYVALMRNRLAAVGESAGPAKASLSKELNAALQISDELAGPAAAAWPEKGKVSEVALRKRLQDWQRSGTLSPLQQKEAADILSVLRARELPPNELALLQLRTINIPFLQKSPNTLWIWGDGLGEYDMLVRKTPLGFPTSQIFRGVEFPQIAPFFSKGRENVLLFNGHGYISQNGLWKGVLRQARPGETRPAATFSADKVIAAAEAAQSPLTSVYIHSCQSGAVFRDLKTLFEKNPAMAQKTEWFVAAAPLQPASSKPLPAQISGASVRERMLDKLLLNITDNGAGLAARAWVKGRDVYPLRASVQKLERELAAAPAAEKAALQSLHDDLQMLLNIADASEYHELMEALDIFRTAHPRNIQYWDRVSYVDAFGGSLEFTWGLKPWEPDAVVNMAPFIRLEQPWVDYVAATAREMFALFKDGPTPPALSRAGAQLRAAEQVRKDLQAAPALLEQTMRRKKAGENGWERDLLSNTSVRDYGLGIEQNLLTMRELELKWQQKKAVFGAKLYEQPALMRQALQDFSQYARLERETSAAQQLYELYNQRAGLVTWSLAQPAAKHSKMFSKYNCNQLARRYLSFLQDSRSKTPAVLRGALDREITRAIKWSDEFALEGAVKWGDDFFPSAPILRSRLAELGKDKKSFTPFQTKEYLSLQRALYRSPVLESDKLLELQNRICFLPHAAPTTNSVFLWGDKLPPLEVWNRKTPLGFFRPKIMQFRPISNALKYFKAGEENVLLVHVHGGISRKGNWKGILIDGELHPYMTISASEVLSALPRTGSVHNYVYVNGCFSGTLLDDVLKLKKQFPQTAPTDWFVTAAPLQYTAPETLPAEFVMGSAQEKLFGKILQRMRYNGDALGARALVDGKEIYPLKESVKRLNNQIRKALPADKVPLRQLREELVLLQQVADARTEQALLQALRQLEQARPGTVKNLGVWREDSPFLQDKRQLLPAQHAGPEGFSWGINMEKSGADISEPYILLKQKWVDYVSDTAQKLFSEAAK